MKTLLLSAITIISVSGFSQTTSNVSTSTEVKKVEAKNEGIETNQLNSKVKSQKVQNSKAALRDDKNANAKGVLQPTLTHEPKVQGEVTINEFKKD